MAWLSDDFLIGQNWRSAPVASVTDYLVQRAHRRYALTSLEPSVTEAWELLSAYQESMYRLDISVQDFDGVKLLPGGSNWDWTTDHSGTQRSSDCLPSACAFTTLPFAPFHAAIGGLTAWLLAAGPLSGVKRPGDMLCKTFQAWSALLTAAAHTDRSPLTGT